MLGWGLVAFGLVIALIATIILLRDTRWFFPWLKGSLGVIVVLAGLLIVMTGRSSLQWQAVSPDGPLYHLSVDSESEGAWRIELRGEGETLLLDRVVQGDLLEVTGRLLVLEVPLGGRAPSLFYQTDSVRGHDSGTGTLVQFRPGKSGRGTDWIDIWHWDRRLLLPLIRAELLYPLWIPMVEGAVFEVVLQGNQIVPIPANSAAEEALQQRQ